MAEIAVELFPSTNFLHFVVRLKHQVELSGDKLNRLQALVGQMVC